VADSFAMPAQAYGLVTLFAAASLLAGTGSAWALGPRHWWAVVLPVLAAFGALYLSGHRLGWSVGPTVTLLGFDVALPFDLGLAVAVALAAAWVQRSALRYLTRGGAAARP